MADFSAATFGGTERYELIRQLGAGTFGTVYEALDRRHGERVALKVLERIDPDGLYRFKREFRALADMRATNLVSLYELASQDDHWFFTMELVEGVPFGTNACGPGERPEQALRHTLVQLIQGVRALHSAGKLHRDIKPSNVLVTPRGRVVLLDFGMVTELGPEQSVDNQVLGTVAYMAPEQAACLPLTTAADWYSVGVLLYVVLCGRLPHGGSVAQILLNKVSLDVPPLAEQVPDLPADLSALCHELLDRDPARRPGGSEILRRLGLRQEPLTGKQAPSEVPLVGRHGELEMMGRALADCADGDPRLVLVHGDSGVGKSALVATFLRQLEGRPLVLRGRCYDRESVPYKAVDGLVDALSHHLTTLQPQQVAELLPSGAAQLARLFPVLRRIPLLDGMAKAFASATVDPQEQRQECFNALRGVLANLARQGPVLLFVDDLQWGDLDSARLLLHVLQPPHAPGVLLLGTYRAAAGPFMAGFLPQAEEIMAARLQQLPLSPLPAEAALALARGLIGARPGEAVSQALAREAAGNPFFIHELARQLLDEPGPDGAAALDSDVTLERMLSERMARLPGDARSLLEVVAVAGQPLEDTVACGAAGLDGGESDTLELLRSERLIRSVSMSWQDPGASSGAAHGVVATYHDRIRETLVAQLDGAQLTRHHLALGQAMEAAGVADRDEAVAGHFEAAGATDRAAAFMIRAAERAAAALAFDHAARLFDRALQLSLASSEEPEAGAMCALRARLADSLSMAGRGVDAGPEYLAAAAEAAPDKAQEWRRCAAEELLRSGHYQQGMEVLTQVLAGVGLALPRTHQRAIISMMLRRAQLRLRGLGFKERALEQIPRQELARIDAAWTVVTGLAFNDTLLSADFQVRHLLLALQTGEPYRVARALAIESSTLATVSASPERIEVVYNLARELATRLEHPHVLGLVEMAAAFGSLMQGRFTKVQAHCEAAVDHLRRWPGTHWEQGIVAFSQHMACFYLGEYRRLNEQLMPLISDCEQRGDLTLAANLKLTAFVASLAQDRPGLARQQLEQVWAMAGAGEFNITHGNVVTGLAAVDNYEGRPREGLQRFEAAELQIKRSQMLRVNWIRLEFHFLRGRMALITAFEDPAMLKLARADAALLGREQSRWAGPVAAALLAGVAAVEGDHEQVLVQLRQVVTTSQECEIPAVGGMAAVQLAWYSGDQQRHRQLCQQLQQQGLANPPRLAQTVVPLAPPELWLTDHHPGSVDS